MEIKLTAGEAKKITAHNIEQENLRLLADIEFIINDAAWRHQLFVIWDAELPTSIVNSLLSRQFKVTKEGNGTKIDWT